MFEWRALRKSPVIILLLLTLFWSPGFSMFKIAVEELSPLTIITLRALVAGLIFYLISQQQTKYQLTLTEIKTCFIFGLIGISIPSYILAYSVIHIDSMISAMAFAISPLCTIIIAHFYLDNEPMNMKKGLGLFMGFVGAILLLIPTLIDGDISHDSYSILLCLGSSFLYGLSLLYAKKNMEQMPSIAALSTSYLSSCVYLIPIWIMIDTPWTIPVPSNTVILSVLGIILICTILGFSTYFYLIKISTASLISLINYMIPIASSFFGVLLLGEPITIFFIMASAFILSGIYLIKQYT